VWKNLEDRDQKFYLTYYDKFTGLTNEKYFKEELKKELNIISSQEKIAVIYLRIFNVNMAKNLIGYDKSNELILDLAKKLNQIKKEPGIRAISIYKGDDFLLLYKKRDKEISIKNRIENLILQLNKYLTKKALDHILEIKVGIAISPEHGNEVSTLLSKAHHALYLAEESNKNHMIYHEEKFLNEYRTEILQKELRQAIDNEQLFVKYQPKIDLNNSRKIESLEALIRWDHPEEGFIPPADFIPQAEKNKLIKHIDIYVLEKVLDQTKNWMNKNIKIKVCVNISLQELINPEFMEKIKEIGYKFKSTNTMIEIEITERAFADITAEKLFELKEIGFTLALDDYGTGYSSLSYLRRYPIDVIKIDKSFIDDIQEERTRILMKAIINLSHDLGISVVAEGIENEVQYNYVKDLEFDYAQGFYFFRPISAGKIEKLLINQQGRVI